MMSFCRSVLLLVGTAISSGIAASDEARSWYATGEPGHRMAAVWQQTEELPEPRRAAPSSRPAEPHEPAAATMRQTTDAQPLSPIPYSEAVLKEQRLRPYLGARIAKNGVGSVTVIRVKPGSPAQRAGLKPGDLIAKVDGTPVASFAAVRSLISTKQPGDTVRLLLQRAGKQVSLNVKLAAVGD